MAKERRNLNISDQVYQNLKNLKSEGQSFNGVLKELLKQVDN